MRTFLRPIILKSACLAAFTFAPFLMMQAAYAQAQNVQPVHVRGSEYLVTRVLSHTHTHKYWGEKIWTYETIALDKDGKQMIGFPLTAKTSEVPKAERKEIKDPRPLQERHPIYHFCIYTGPQLTWNIVSTFW